MIKTNEYLFSVVIPTYNRRVNLEKCLNSLVEQTFKNFEVVICDNASTDGTTDFVENYRELLNINYIRLSENSGGPARPRNTGILNSKGEWICFLDSDDWFASNKLEYISNLNLDEFDFLYHDLDVVKKDTIIYVNTSRDLSAKDPYKDLLCNLNAIPTSSSCVRKSFLLKANGFSEDKNIIGLEDFHLWIRIAKFKARFMYLRKVLGSYYIGDDNLTHHDERQVNRFKALYSEFINETDDIRFSRKIVASLDYQTGWIFVNNSEPKRAFGSLFRSLFSGSIPIKLRSINMLIKGFRYLLNQK